MESVTGKDGQWIEINVQTIRETNDKQVRKEYWTCKIRDNAKD